MEIETALASEPLEQIYGRIFRSLKPRTPVPEVKVTFRKYANANSRVKLLDGQLTIEISDLLEDASPQVQEALACILLSKLFRKHPESSMLARYRRFLNRADVRSAMYSLKRARGRKMVLDPCGRVYDLCEIFEGLNVQYFFGLMARPRLGWSVRASRSTLGHYDPSHHTIVLTNLLDSADVPKLLVNYIMFHEMLHLRFPTQHKGTRRCVHTREFKQAERKFESYDEAEHALRKFVERLPRRRGK